ncbi:hypothetical protein L1987_66542 [Smallanthus sonchifolius]|uniref:Uncharacterized protein n=1 Tax=Smallanthus sonchifolius TaxID=185202 RepID=A0ACB9BXR4_9ASTR|nr:hypothetical protein L1987_66542 [Smallanthus sonchifolius]
MASPPSTAAGFILLLLFHAADVARSQSYIGVNYGMVADNLPPPSATSKLLQSTSIGKVRLYGADPAIIKALANTGIGITIGAANGDIPSMAADVNFAKGWIGSNVLPYYPASKIILINVGNEVLQYGTPELKAQLLPAMKNVQTALDESSLGGKIKVSTVHSMSVLGQSEPPSAGRFDPSIGDLLKGMLEFNKATGSPFMINPYPFFAYQTDPRPETLAFCLFQPNAGRPDSGNNIKYMNMFDAQVDAVRSALNAMTFNDVEIVVAETGWPYKGDVAEAGATVENAKAYNGNLVAHLRSMVGTPLMPGKSIDTYLFALYDEDLKPGKLSEKAFGIYNVDSTPIYDAGLSKGSQGDLATAPTPIISPPADAPTTGGGTTLPTNSSTTTTPPSSTASHDSPTARVNASKNAATSDKIGASFVILVSLAVVSINTKSDIFYSLHRHLFYLSFYSYSLSSDCKFTFNKTLFFVIDPHHLQMATLISDTAAWKDMKAHVGEIDKTHLRDLMADTDRCKSMMLEFDGIFLDYSRQRATANTVSKLFALAEEAHLKQKIDSMFNGEHINSTENRSVLHVALRASKDTAINSDGKNVVPDVWQVLDKIKEFSDKVRSGSWVGATGKALTNVIAIGIGGSFLGPLFVHTALQTDPEASKSAGGRQLRFLANVDPVDVARNISGLDPETTLVVVVSKTFTTAETMLNARTLREWISSALGPQAVSKHMVAVSTNLKLVEKFGIDPNNAFAFWDWVGGRYSVCSAVGVLPLSLQYGFSVIEKFLKGARSIDQHFHSAPFEKNIPVLLGLLSVWNVSFLGYPARAILPYTQALEKFAPHIQQVSMESNGKGVSIDGVRLPFEAGEIDFGEPGTNGQHSFYQLIHQGRVIPCDFIGTVKSQQPVYLKDEVVNNHDELMSNFFAQPDALAYGKTPEQLQSENVASHLVPHKTFTGNRPSVSLLLPSLDAYRIGQLLAIYEHRIAVEGFVWGINSFDQWGVELGKSLASQVRKQLHASRKKGESVEGFNFSTTKLLTRYLEASADVPSEPTTLLPTI